MLLAWDLYPGSLPGYIHRRRTVQGYEKETGEEKERQVVF
jgi:hypothetical protein